MDACWSLLIEIQQNPCDGLSSHPCQGTGGSKAASHFVLPKLPQVTQASCCREFGQPLASKLWAAYIYTCYLFDVFPALSQSKFPLHLCKDYLKTHSFPTYTGQLRFQIAFPHSLHCFFTQLLPLPNFPPAMHGIFPPIYTVISLIMFEKWPFLRSALPA